MEVGVPKGPVPFMIETWQQLFQHVVTEAQRLGLEVNMNNDAGWNGSGGPWSLHFPPNAGAPESVELDKLISMAALEKKSPLQPSGLIGPVTLQAASIVTLDKAK